MNEEPKRDRSPNYPKLSLESAMLLIAGFYNKAGKAQLNPQVAASALGYSGTNGAALTTIGALNQYGLLERQRGEGMAVSQLAIKLLHPVNSEQELASRREMALKPKVFSDLYSGGFHHCDESILANHLIQQGFTQDGARKAASVFKANVDYAKLVASDFKLASSMDLTHDELVKETSLAVKGNIMPSPFLKETTIIDIKSEEKKVLAKFSVPIGANEVEITFTGEVLRPDDFDALADYVALFKKQYQRKLNEDRGVATFAKRRISGIISTLPRVADGRIAFLLSLPDGQVMSCLSGAGTNFNLSDFVNGQGITLAGETKSDLIAGETSFFVFSDFDKPGI
jgi:hypothetical protein